MSEPAGLENVDDEAVRVELLKMLDREEARLAAEVSESLAKGAKEAEEFGPDARNQWQTFECRMRQRGKELFSRMRDYVQRSR